MVKKGEQKANPAARRQTKAKAKKKLPLAKAPEEYIFWCSDGCTFRDLRELAKGLTAISNETFFHHVNQERNDFSNWVRDVINDIELASALAQATSKDEAATCVTARLEFYE